MTESFEPRKGERMSRMDAWNNEWCVNHPARMAHARWHGQLLCDDCAAEAMQDDDEPEGWEPDFTVDPNDPSQPGWEP